MPSVNVYEQYFAADAVFSGVQRRAVRVCLTADSGAGHIRYTLSLSFFPHNDPEDFAVSYDACFETVLFDADGRRSAKREKAFLASLRAEADALAAEAGGTVDWEQPLIPARLS